MTAGLALLGAALVVLAAALYVFALASRERREAGRTIRAKDADFAIEREQAATERSTLIAQMAELADRPLSGSLPARARLEESPEAAAWRDSDVEPAGDQLIE